MNITFHKYHGNGNDFILIDNRDLSVQLNTDQIVQLCHRRFGIGSDGIILLEPHASLDYEMVFFNPDGSQSFCGNGSRCALHFAQQLGIIRHDALFLAIDGEHEGKIEGANMCIHMKDVVEIESGSDYHYLNTGSPHYVKLVDDLTKVDVFKEGQAIRYNDRFKKEGTNVNFLDIKNKVLSSRVYERGVENETYSSGTGTTAQAISAFLHRPDLGNNIELQTKGGTLRVSFERTENGFKNIWLIGPVSHVFSGNVSI